MTSQEFRKTKPYRNCIKFLSDPVIPGVFLDSRLELDVTLSYHRAVLEKYLSILEEEFKNVSSSS